MAGRRDRRASNRHDPVGPAHLFLTAGSNPRSAQVGNPPEERDTTMPAKSARANTNASTSQPSNSAASAGSTSVAGYLFGRLAQAGVRSVFGVTDDHGRDLIEAIAGHPEMTWIPMATDFGAVNAAGMYARLRGVGAAVTSAGAGEPVPPAAGEWIAAETAPVVHIISTPPRAAAPRRRTARRGAEVTATVAETDLRPRTAAAEIDRVLDTALRTRRPVSITIAADVARAPMLVAPRRAQTLRRQDAGLAIRGSDGDISWEPGTINKPTNGSEVAGQSRAASQWSALAEFLSPGDLVLA